MAAPAPTTALSAIDVTMVVVGDFYAVEHFLVLLEELPRALRVTGLSMAPGSTALSDDPAAATDGRSVEATVSGRVFLTGGTAPARRRCAGRTRRARRPVPSTETVS